ncbi:outer membrane beta-barrel protein [Halalkalibaculum sp. DA384]|uniref:outer membrane beta-barrel protein n=1 Tax=Halalkalibaculum sp. DA384 TaxID=3373606 RepID=UPI003754D97F
MPDKKNHNDPIEELFRKKAEEYEIEFREGDWRKLEDQLDKVEARQARNRRWRWIAAASILLISLLGYFTYENYQAISQINKQLSEQAPARQEAPVDRRPEEMADEPSQEPPAAGSELSSGEGSGQAASPREVPNGATDAGGPGTPAVEQTDQETTRPHHFAISEEMGRDLFIPRYRCPDCRIFGRLQQLMEPAPFLLAESSALPPVVQRDPQEKTESHLTGRPPVGADNVSARSSSPLSVGFVAGPDLSTVGGFSNFSDPGYKIGLAVEYRLAPRLSINSGIGQANVQYTARGREYKPPYGYWSNGIVADQTVAECAILEIPVNLKYDLLQFEKSRVYTSAGVASYIMLNEEYRFNYERDDTGLVQSWKGKTGSRHWLSNITLSAGYELDMPGNWSVRAEPFVKLPLKEVGWGNVKLYSVGTSISLNLNL